MEHYLSHEAVEYRKALKYFKIMAQQPKDPRQSAEEHEREHQVLAITMDALRFANLIQENPPLTRAHLKNMHGCAIYLERDGISAGIVDCNDETIVTLGLGRTFRDEWFGSLPGRYYRFPVHRDQ